MQIFAHRGASGDCPENTLLAMEEAIKQGADGIELDVQQAKDALVVTHDRFIQTPAALLHVARTPLAKLQQIPLPQEQCIPTLDQVMQCINGRCLVNVELKTLEQFEMLKQVLTQSIKHYHFEPEQIIVSAFNHHLLKEVQHWEMGVEIAALTSSLPLDLASFAVDMHASALHADVNTLHRILVEDAHQHGLPVRVYTVDHALDIQRLAEWGVDAIFTNYPAITKKQLSDIANLCPTPLVKSF